MKLPLHLGVILLSLAIGSRPALSLAQEPGGKAEGALGKLLFTDLLRVYFTGPGRPANADGTLGGLVADENGGQMKIYENYICREFTDQAGATVVRELHAYDKLGKVEQRSTATVMSAWHPGDANDILPSGEKRKAKPRERPSRPAPQSDVEVAVEAESLAQQFQKAKDKGASVVLYVSQQRFRGKVISVSAQQGLVQLKDEDGFNLYVVLAKVDALLIP